MQVRGAVAGRQARSGGGAVVWRISCRCGFSLFGCIGRSAAFAAGRPGSGRGSGRLRFAEKGRKVLGRGAEWVFLCLYCYGMREAVVILLRGVGQVLFRRSALSGLLMLAGIAAGSWRIALLALCGNAAGNLTARLCRYPVQEIHDGLYGFNGTLVGIAVGIFFRWGWETALLLVAASALATLSVRLFARCRLQGFTAPFILAVWMLSGVVALWMPELRVAAVVFISRPIWPS